MQLSVQGNFPIVAGTVTLAQVTVNISVNSVPSSSASHPSRPGTAIAIVLFTKYNKHSHESKVEAINDAYLRTFEL